MGTPIKPMVTLSEWDHHQYRQLEPTHDGNNVSSDSCLVCAGPPLLSMTGGITANATEDSGRIDRADMTAYPIGLAQGVGIGQNRQQMRIYEIGSPWDYIITGRNVGQLTINRIFHSSTSLLRVLYAYYSTTGVTQIDPLFESPIIASTDLNDVYISPGSQRFYMNLFSDLFKNPIGILLIMNTGQNETVGAFYHERCMVHGHNISFDSQGIIIQENVTLSFSRVTPVHIEPLPLLAAAKNFGDMFDLSGT